MALERLEQDPFARGGFHPGDLLSAVLRNLDRHSRTGDRSLDRIVRLGERARRMIAGAASQRDENGGADRHERVSKDLVRAFDELLAKSADHRRRPAERGGHG